MTPRGSIRLLQIVLAAVLCYYSAMLVATQIHSTHHGHATVFLLALGAAEAIAAVLLLFSVRRGGIALLVVFAAAAMFHLLHGQVRDIGVLAIYAASVLAVMTNIGP